MLEKRSFVISYAVPMFLACALITVFAVMQWITSRNWLQRANDEYARVQAQIKANEAAAIVRARSVEKSTRESIQAAEASLQRIQTMVDTIVDAQQLEQAETPPTHRNTSTRAKKARKPAP